MYYKSLQSQNEISIVKLLCNRILSQNYLKIIISYFSEKQIKRKMYLNLKRLLERIGMHVSFLSINV